MRILITTGIYPPQIGGPAQYAKNLKTALEKIGHQVDVATYSFERKLPSGIRHFAFFIKIIPKFIKSDLCISLDTFSVAFPSVAAGILFKKKVMIRTGGDFLWEQYLNRTKEKILLKNFYKNLNFKSLSIKERNIFVLTHWTLKRAAAVIFSTDWQRDIWQEPYKIDLSKTYIIENFHGSKLEPNEPKEKNFVGVSRQIQFKNLDTLKEVFDILKSNQSEARLDLEVVGHEQFLEKLKNCYAVILISLGDISPNFIMDAIRFNKPFILTRENGITERIHDVAILVDPLDKEDIISKINYLLDSDNYNKQVDKIKNFNFCHSWDDIAKEFIEVHKKIK